MERCSISSLKKKSITFVEIHTHQCGFYTAQCQISEYESATVCQKNGKPLTTKSLIEMKNAFSSVHVQEVFLVSQTPYDEMINTDTFSEPVKARLHW